MESAYNVTKFLMKKYDITANKKLGQNFLIDDNIIEQIVNSANIEKDDLVIEIGPGLGILTEKLLEQAGKVICIELDDRMVKILKDIFFMYKNFEIINDDVLKVDLKTLISKNKLEGIKRVKVVANLPYYITTPIIMKLLEEKLDIESITVMIQKEVAKRLASVPGEKETGAITYTVYYYSEVEEIVTVSNTSFIPQPEVESEVIKLKIRKTPAIEVNDEEKLFKIIKVAFMQRRKTLINALCNSELKLEKQKIEQILTSLEIDKKIRGEALTIEQFAKISELVI